ncbi:hypothetical protein ACFZB6_09045 [Streptomyces syringium]|uniref:hypothetical protein n=1 Tax=Streptomyces syringium TaxID=76729 RepID=UPI0033A19C9C
MGQVNQPSTLIDQVGQLRKELAELRKRVGIGNATISGGVFTVQRDGAVRMVDAAGNEVLYFGPDGTGRQVIRIARDGGRPVLHTYPTLSGQQHWALSDRSGGFVVSDDTGSGDGLATPWIPVAFEKVRFADMPSVTNASFETVWEANFQRSHPCVELYTVDGCDDGTTGEGRVVITDPVTGRAVVAGSWGSGGGPVRARRGPYALPGRCYAGPVRVAVDYRRTGGGGKVYAVVMDATQRQTP